VELLASGRVAITIDDEQGPSIRRRRMVGHTVVGEFYRQVSRTATVIAEEPTVVYRLTRASFNKQDAGRGSRGCDSLPYAYHPATFRSS
jgi:SulP family sulfate permease